MRVGKVIKSGSLERSLTMTDVTWSKKGGQIPGLKVEVQSYKFSHGETQKLFITRQPQGEISQNNNMLRYLSQRGQEPGYLFMGTIGKVITRDWLAKKMGVLFTAMGLDGTHYNTHSFRNGSCTHWAQWGNQ